MIDFSGRVALITGAGRGLGLAYARGLAARGATVVLQDTGASPDGTGTDSEVARLAAASIPAAGGRVLPETGPIGTRSDCHALVERTLAATGRLDILIHNAGWVGYQDVERIDPEFHGRMMRLGVDTPLWLAQAAWQAMRSAGFGRILLTTSDRAIYPEYAQEGLASYAAAKMAAVGIVNVLALEGAPHGILANAISPVAKTRMWGVEGTPDDLTPDAVAPGAIWLVSDECAASGWVLRAANGQFVATRASEATGVSYPHDLAAVPATRPEEVAEAWTRIAVPSPEPRPVTRDAAREAAPVSAILGECPLWSARTGSLLWVDTEGRTLNRFDPRTGRNAATGMPDVVGMVAERDDGALLVSLGCDLATVGADGSATRFATAPHGGDGFRLNDGRLDASGRLWIGLMSNRLEPGSGVLYRHDPDGTWHVVDDGFTLINGLDWSPDRRTLYVTDSRERVIHAYDHDPVTGAIGGRRPFVVFGPDEGFPDGLLVDPAGDILSTLFDGARVVRLSSGGRRLGTVELPVTRPTSCCLSPDGSTLYVTTARLGLDPAALDREPMAGALLAVCAA